MNPDVVIVLACLNEQDLLIGVFSQALGQHTASAACPNDDVVVDVGLSHML
jgi:hypothetical protein